jgi:hypothetical protein
MFPVIYTKSRDGLAFCSWRLVKAETSYRFAEWARIRVDRAEIATESFWSEPDTSFDPATEAEFAAAYKAALEKIYAERTLCIVQQTENAKQAERLTETTL